MSTTPVTGGATSLLNSSSSSQTNAANSLDNVDTSQFLQMMLTEMQNQDPLNPMQTSQIMDELGQMQQITASNKLTSTLDGMALGQSLNNATSLLGKSIDGIDDSGNPASGVVSKVSVSNSTAKLYVGSQVVSLSNVQDVLPN
ncbi:MAG TPA: flagellar hook capping FlgD N-terminal domain-containing protein [Pirellulales bacterium]|nr:flagellar hook capping FlgD N-terminal domain-containing protein [Pirellulales bacterium]